jgi:uncharacterized protein YdaU (DUF1376 family)
VLYFKLHIGDWITGTRLCSPFERGIYIDLLTLYYSKERPLMRDECERIASAYAPEMRKSFDYVLNNFFEKDGDTYRNHRADQEIAEYTAISEKNKASANARWQKRKKADASQHADVTHSEGNAKEDANAYASAPANADTSADADAMPSIIHKPLSINSPKGECESADAPRRTRTRPAKKELNFLGLPEDLVADWKEHRKSMGAPLTQTAIDRFKSEADKAGWTLEQAVRFSILIGSKGFLASWESVKNATRNGNASAADDEKMKALHQLLMEYDRYCAPYVAKTMRPPMDFDQWKASVYPDNPNPQDAQMSIEEQFALEGGR